MYHPFLDASVLGGEHQHLQTKEEDGDPRYEARALVLQEVWELALSPGCPRPQPRPLHHSFPKARPAECPPRGCSWVSGRGGFTSQQM